MKKPIYYIIIIILTTLNCCSNDDIEQEALPPISNIPKGYIARYSLNGNANDDSEYRNHGKFEGPIITRTNRNGYEDSAMYFSKESSLYVPDSKALNLSNTISISVWVKAGKYTGTITNGLHPWRTIVNKWGFFDGYFLAINPYGHLRWRIENEIIESSAPFPINEWTHIVVIYDGKSLKIYLNGILDNSAPYIGTIEPNTFRFTIGQQSNKFGLNGRFLGLIDEVVIYNRALNEKEIDLLYKDEY